MKILFKQIKLGDTFYTRTTLSEPESRRGEGRLDVPAWMQLTKINGSQGKCTDASASWRNRRMINGIYYFGANRTAYNTKE